MILTMCLMQENLRPNVTHVAMYQSCFRLQLKVIVQLFLLMGKQALEKRILWLENKNCSLEKYTKVMRGKV